MPVAHKDAFVTDRHQLATLLDLAPDAERLWGDAELEAILRHQMIAPMQVDLINLERGLAIKVRNLVESLGLTLKSFGDLLAHPSPPVELLKLTKDFAKACRLSPHSPSRTRSPRCSTSPASPPRWSAAAAASPG